jgi:hypothetical protein
VTDKVKTNIKSVCLYAYPVIGAGQWLGENVIAATDTRATTEELLDQ